MSRARVWSHFFAFLFLELKLIACAFGSFRFAEISIYRRLRCTAKEWEREMRKNKLWIYVQWKCELKNITKEKIYSRLASNERQLETRKYVSHHYVVVFLSFTRVWSAKIRLNWINNNNNSSGKLRTRKFETIFAQKWLCSWSHLIDDHLQSICRPMCSKFNKRKPLDVSLREYRGKITVSISIF